MARRLLIGILLICTLSYFVVAQDIPTMIQPQEASYSPAQLTALEEAIDQLAGDLNCTELGSRKRLGEGGWTVGKSAAYTAGSLEQFGYQVAIVSRQMDGIGTETWVVVRVDLGGAVAWIPVEPVPYEDIHQIDLGVVPLLSPLVFDSSYLQYDTVLHQAPNIPPTASIRAPRQVVETERSAWFGNTSVDPDGEIVLFQWTFGEIDQRATHTVSAWYSFEDGGMEYPVSLTVTDSRGAQATTSITIYVKTLAEK